MGDLYLCHIGRSVDSCAVRVLHLWKETAVEVSVYSEGVDLDGSKGVGRIGMTKAVDSDVHMQYNRICTSRGHSLRTM
jgi:hypothetical protein